jgi:flagellin-like hook-associated protein FlgL
MISSLSAVTNQFLNDLSRVQSLITTTTQQMTSGYRINQPSDAPDQISPLLQLMAGSSYNQTVLGNLSNVQGTVSSADQAVSSAIQLLQQATSLGAQGASSTTSATTRSQLAEQVEGIQEQMVALAGTQVSGRYIFSGDQAGSLPYALNLNPPAVTVGSAPAARINAGDTATFTVQTASGSNTIAVTGQADDTLQGQIDELNSQLQAQGLDITASLDSSGKLQLQSNDAFSVSAIAGVAANLVGTTAETADNTGLNNYRFSGQAPAQGGGTDIEITVGGKSVTAVLADPLTPSQADVDAINAALQTQGITNVSALLDLTANAISFQGSARFSVSDDHLVSGTYVANGDSVVGAQNGVDRLVASQQATRQIDIGDHTSIAVDQTAQDIFDHRNADDSLASDNVFAALNSLRIALINNDTAGVTAAQSSLETASQYLNSKAVFYGSATNRISAATNQLNTENVSLQQQISSIRDTDVVQAAETLVSAETQNQAALEAEAKLPRTTLFDYLG